MKIVLTFRHFGLFYLLANIMMYHDWIHCCINYWKNLLNILCPKLWREVVRKLGERVSTFHCVCCWWWRSVLMTHLRCYFFCLSFIFFVSVSLSFTLCFIVFLSLSLTLYLFLCLSLSVWSYFLCLSSLSVSFYNYFVVFVTICNTLTTISYYFTVYVLLFYKKT